MRKALASFGKADGVLIYNDVMGAVKKLVSSAWGGRGYRRVAGGSL
jgi:hypothetical protein